MSSPSAKDGRRRPNRISAPPPPTDGPLTTSAARPAGAVFRLRPMSGAPSTRTIEIPNRSPLASAPSAVSATEPTGASTMHRSAARPGAMMPVSSPWTRAVLPVARQTTVSGATPPREARCAIRRRIPSGTTPVPDGASLPRITRSSASASAAAPSATRAVRPLPQWTSSRAIPESLSTSRAMSRSGQGRRATVDVAGDVRVRLQDRVRPDRAGPGERRAAGVVRGDHPVGPAPGDHRSGIRAGLDRAQPDLADEPDPGRRQLDEVRLDHPELQDRRAGPDLDATWTDVGVAVVHRDRQGLQADDVLRATRQVDLARRDHRGHAAVQRGLDEVRGPLARRVVAEDRVRVGVDEAGHDGRPMSIDDDVRVGLEPAPDRLDAPVGDDDRVGIEQRGGDVARDELADPGDQGAHAAPLSGGRLRRRHRPPAARRPARTAGRRWSPPAPAAARPRPARPGRGSPPRRSAIGPASP